MVDSVEMFWYATSKTKNQKQNKPAQKTLQKLQQQQKTKNPNHMIMINNFTAVLYNLLYNVYKYHWERTKFNKS